MRSGGKGRYLHIAGNSKTKPMELNSTSGNKQQTMNWDHFLLPMKGITNLQAQTPFLPAIAQFTLSFWSTFFHSRTFGWSSMGLLPCPGGSDLLCINPIIHHGTIIMATRQVVHLSSFAKGVQMQPSNTDVLWRMDALPKRSMISISSLMIKTTDQHISKDTPSTCIMVQGTNITHVGSWHGECWIRSASICFDVVVKGGHSTSGTATTTRIAGTMAESHLTTVLTILLGIGDHRHLAGIRKTTCHERAHWNLPLLNIIDGSFWWNFVLSPACSEESEAFVLFTLVASVCSSVRLHSSDSSHSKAASAQVDLSFSW